MIINNNQGTDKKVKIVKSDFAAYLKDVSDSSNIKKLAKNINFLFLIYLLSFFGIIIKKLHISAMTGR